MDAQRGQRGWIGLAARTRTRVGRLTRGRGRVGQVAPTRAGSPTRSTAATGQADEPRPTAATPSLGDRPAVRGAESGSTASSLDNLPAGRAGEPRPTAATPLLGHRPAGPGGESSSRRPDAGPARKRGPGVSVRRLLVLPLLAVLAAGCGIRSTEVPTDFGPAPSRVRCSLSESGAAQASGGLAVQVFLLCGSSLVAVDRTVRVPDGTEDSARRVLVAQGLLDQLAEAPSAAEQDAGYQTYVRGGTTVSGPRPKDPEDTLRLSTPPGELSRYALAQLGCTFSDSAAAEGDGSVILGGPGTAPTRRYDCTDEVRSQPSSHQPPSSEVTKG